MLELVRRTKDLGIRVVSRSVKNSFSFTEFRIEYISLPLLTTTLSPLFTLLTVVTVGTHELRRS